jgi:hypothetical protein
MLSYVKLELLGRMFWCTAKLESVEAQLSVQPFSWKNSISLRMVSSAPQLESFQGILTGPPLRHVEAIQKVASVRSVVQPLEFFLHQLEIFERCNFDLDPNKYAAYRRFLMNFNAQEMIGESSSLALTTYNP